MMLYKNGIEFGSIYHNNEVIAIVYHNGKIVWQGIRSCFGGGLWQNDKPWLEDEAWKN